MRRAAAILGALTVASLFGAACAGDRPTLDSEGLAREADATPPSTTTTTVPAPPLIVLRLAVGSDWHGDPAEAGPASLSWRVLADLQFEGLVGVDSDGELVPGLASEWTVSPDRLRWTVTIAEDAVAHDGTSVTARDVMLSLDRVAARVVRT